MGRAVALLAPAKLNLTLEVLARRDDGYHELRSVYATIALADRVRVSAARELAVRIVPPLGTPAEDELATRAVRVLADACDREPRLLVTIRKRIPIAAGLGGGSSDAGAVLRALASLWRMEDLDLEHYGARVGSDVPFFAAGCDFALVGGRGERIEALPPPPAPLWACVVRPRAQLFTAAVFAERRADERGDGSRSERLAAAFRDGSVTAALLRECATNDLAAPAERLCPEMASLRAAAGAKGIALHVSGSGPTLFAIADDRGHAIALARSLRRIGVHARPFALGMR
jgi:4-diphosphocytidyl-2-C-methyl-D-erythritol kinase